MFLPIGDTPNPRTTPYVNYLLIAVNVGIFLFVSLPLTLSRPDLSDPLLLEYLRAMGAQGRIPAQAVLQHVSAYDLFVYRYGFRPADPSVSTLFTAMFLHGGWLHLAGNMLFLWIFGDNVEARVGRLRYLLVYLGTGILATFFFAVFVPESQVPMVGASGAISGVLGCYFVWFPRNQVKTFIFFFPFLMTTVLIPARLVLGVYLVLDNILPWLVSAGKASGVAHGAHIGGFVGGVVLAWITARLEGGRGRRAERDGAPAELTPAARVSRSLRLNNPGQAAMRFLALSDEERSAVPTEDILAIGSFLLERRDYHGALGAFRRVIADRPNDPQLDQAFLGAGKAAMRIPRGVPAAGQYFLSAVDIAASDELASEARGYLRGLDRS